MKYARPEADEWIRPVETDYKLSCCDCGLVHNMDFKIEDGRVWFRVRRNNRSTSLMRRHMKKNKIEKQLEPTEIKTADINDLIQYVTNLLYAAFDHKINPSEFDGWVDEKTGELKDYYSGGWIQSEPTERKTAEEMMPSDEIVWDAAQRLEFVEFCLWYNDHVKRLNKFASQSLPEISEVWVALYNPMIHESAYTPISVHKTEKGAQMAMDFHKEEERKRWIEMYPTKEDQEEYPFGHFERWNVLKIELLS
jgi:hypothetical protein